MQTKIPTRVGTTALVAVLAIGSGLCVGAPASAVLPAIDPYQPYVANAVTACPDSNYYAKPGVVAFRDMILSRMGGSDLGILACSGYEHEEGRAWDWGNSRSDAADTARVQMVLDWMFATDADGNPHAMARRLGIAYVLWDGQVINMYSSDKQWHAFSCNGWNSCHRDHVHIAFSWAGARQETTWFTTSPRPDNWYPDYVAPTWTSGSMIQDFSGDGKRDLIWRYDANHDLKLLRGNGAGGFLDGGVSSTIGGFDIPDMVTAVPDFDGDGHVDILWRNRYNKNLMLLRGNGAGGFLDGGVSSTIGGFDIADRIFSSGDFDGDSKTDIIWRDKNTKDLMLLRGNGAGGFLNGGTSTAIGGFGVADIIFSPGDFDGDGKADIVWRNATTKDLMLLRGNGAGGFLNGGTSTAIGGFSIADMIL